LLDLEVLVNNLIKNAIEHNFKNGWVKISLAGNTLKVANSGEKISANDLDRIFDSFFKGKKAENQSQNFGLGLALVKEVLQKNNWKIKVSSHKKKNTFEVRF
jgi:signal transduction histidine kinase